MVPVLCLDIEPHHAVLDMCASPGSKTSQVPNFLTTVPGTFPPTPSPIKLFNNFWRTGYFSGSSGA
jgi:multisite-specific tRNA:(cytosine-C5)-methyltransferase